MISDDLMIFACRGFSNPIFCTATSGALEGLAAAFDRGIGPALGVLNQRSEEFFFEFAPSTFVKMEAPYSHTNGRIGLASRDSRRLAEELRKLAGSPERSRLSLSDLGVLDPETSTHDLTFELRSPAPPLAEDHRIPTAGSTWEAYLLHPPLSLTQLMEAREGWLSWVLRSPERFEEAVFLQSAEHDRVRCPPAEAYERLLQSEDCLVMLFGETPLVCEFGSPLRNGQAWFTRESAEAILSEELVSTGDWRVDIDNFLRYRDLIVGWSDLLSPSSIAWGQVADCWPQALHKQAADLHDASAMWEWFELNFSEGLDRTQEVIPAWVREEFETRFAAR